MTLDTEQRIATPAKTAAKPAPRAVEESEYRLFQTMDELRTRHGGARSTKERILHAAAALAGGSLLFTGLYAVVLFLQ